MEETLFPILDHTYICKTSVLLFILKASAHQQRLEDRAGYSAFVLGVISWKRKVLKGSTISIINHWALETLSHMTFEACFLKGNIDCCLPFLTLRVKILYSFWHKFWWIWPAPAPHFLRTHSLFATFFYFSGCVRVLLQKSFDLHCDMQDLLVAACKLLVAVCGI